MYYLATFQFQMSVQDFWASTPRKLNAISEQHAVAQGTLKTKEQVIQEEIDNVRKFEASFF